MKEFAPSVKDAMFATPEPVLIVAFWTKVTLPRFIGELDVATVPASETSEATAVKPLVKVVLSVELSPNVTVPRLLKTVGLAEETMLLVPINATE